MFIPDPATKKVKGRHQTRRIWNGMDESEASKAQKRCSQCEELSHNYKKCPQNALHDATDSQCGELSHNYKKCPQNALHDAADAGPS